MQIPHRSVSVFLAGVALGIGGSIIVERMVVRRSAAPKEPQARSIPVLTSPLLLQGEPAFGDPSAPLTIVDYSDFE